MLPGSDCQRCIWPANAPWWYTYFQEREAFLVNSCTVQQSGHSNSLPAAAFSGIIGTLRPSAPDSSPSELDTTVEVSLSSGASRNIPSAGTARVVALVEAKMLGILDSGICCGSLSREGRETGLGRDIRVWISNSEAFGCHNVVRVPSASLSLCVLQYLRNCRRRVMARPKRFSNHGVFPNLGNLWSTWRISNSSRKGSARASAALA